MDKFIVFPYSIGTSYLNAENVKDNLILVGERIQENNPERLYILFEKAIKNNPDIESILLIDSFQDVDKRIYVNAANVAKSNGKNVYASEAIYAALKNRGINFINRLQGDNGHKVITKPETLHIIEKPVIAVFGMGENTEKFKIQLGLCDALHKFGYNVLTIASNDLSSLLGLGSMPSFMYSEELSMKQKIWQFNSYVYQAIQSKNPDFVLIGVPGGITKYDRYIDAHYGELAYIISQAVEIDYAITSFYYNPMLNAEFLEYMDNFVANHLGLYIDKYVISPTTCTFDSENRVVSYNYYLNDYYDEYYPKIAYDNRIVNFYKIDYAEIVKNIVGKLSSNFSVV